MIVALPRRAPNNQAVLKALTPEQKLLAANFSAALAADGAPTPGEIAAACGISEQAVSNWKRSGKISVKNLEVVSRMTGWSVTRLLLGGPDDTEEASEMIVPSDTGFDMLVAFEKLPERLRQEHLQRVLADSALWDQDTKELMARVGAKPGAFPDAKLPKGFAPPTMPAPGKRVVTRSPRAKKA